MKVRGVGFAGVFGAAVLAACNGTPQAPGGQAGAGGSMTAAGTGGAGGAPVDTRAAVLSCPDGVGPVALTMPCLLGMTPISTVECALGSDPAMKLSFILPLSLPDTERGVPALGEPTTFRPTFLPLSPPATVPGGHPVLGLSGTVVFTAFSLEQASFDGRFTHLEMTLGSPDGTTVTCALDDRPFRAIPGNFL
jgi:hypothetical protein